MMYSVVLLGITFGFLTCAQAETEQSLAQVENVQSVETDQWLKWDDQHRWSGIDHFLSSWKGEGTVDPEPLQEKIFQGRSAVMSATAQPEAKENVQLLQKSFSHLCDGFDATSKSDCFNAIIAHKEEVCKDTVVADRQTKTCSTMVNTALSSPIVEENPSDSDASSQHTSKQFRIPGT